ncbi:MAG TPA: MMPL family transporter, partial [Polyangiaceae bacterium]
MSDSTLTSCTGLAGFVDWLIRHRVRVLLLCGVVFCVAGARTVLTYSKLRSDLEELLPATAPAVSALETLRSRLPGLRHLGVVVDTGGKQNLPAARRFIDDLSQRLRTYPKHLVGEVRSDVTREQEFARTYLLQLMDLEDAAALRKAVEARRDWEVTHALDMNLLESDEDPPPEIPVQRLRKKYLDKHKLEASFPEGRLESQNGDTAILLVQTAYHSTGQDGDETLLARVRSDVRELGFPERYAPGMRVGFAADVATRVEELEGLQTDLTLSGLLVSALVVLVIVWYFKAWQAPLILGVPLALGTVCAFGVAALPPLDIRHLNSNTAFLGAIVVGNGVNTGIIVLARFQEERRQFAELRDAIIAAIRETWKPTLAAAASASAAYGSLVFTDFRGFNQFGWIGGFGMLLCWGTTMLLLPPLLSFFGEATARRARSEAPETQRHIGWFARFLLSRPRVVAGVTLTATVLALFGLGRRASDWIEYDLSQLRRRDSWESGERYWGARMDRTLGRYLTPSVVMADTPKQAESIKQKLLGAAERGEAGDLIASVQTASSWLRPTRF